MKKYIFITAIFIIRIIYVSAQEYKVPVSNTKDGKLIIEDFKGDLPVQGYDGNEIIITGMGDKEDYSPPARAKGLKPLYGRGIDNTGIGISIEKDGNQVKITCLMPITKPSEYKIKVPNNFAVKIESGCENSSEITVQDIKNEVEVKNCQSITIKNVTGSLVLNTISGNISVDKCAASADQTISLATVSGDISIVFSEFNTKNPVSITTISGELDVTLAPKAATSLKMKSISGELYSDFDLTIVAKGAKMKHYGGNLANYSLNGGGTEMSLSSISGNVYLRKGK